MTTSLGRVCLFAVLLACGPAHDSPSPGGRAPARNDLPPRLAKVFRHLDSALTQPQRDSLLAARLHTPTDSLYQYRLTLLVTDRSVWPPSLRSADSLAAAVADWQLSHFENLAGAMLDAYVQHLRGAAVDMAAVRHRVPLAPRPGDFKALMPPRDRDRAR